MKSETTTTTTADDALSAFPVRTPITVQWGDQDAFQHVNNVVYFRWYETARMKLFERIGFTGSQDGTGSNAVGPILHSTSCRYKAPVLYPDELVVGTRVVDVGVDRFAMEMALFSTTRGFVVATGEALIVSFDYRTQTKAPIPDEVVAAIRALG
ncbi:MAG TPA: thioesterase family protein [Myxococcota bacterium]